jgi:lambda family phage portal protein
MGKRKAAKLDQQQITNHILRAFEGAKQSRRTENWLTSTRGPNADLKPALQWLISRHQDLIDSDPWIRRAVDVIVSNVIGTGIEGAPIGGTKAFNAGFQEWAGSTSCDFYGRTNLWGLQETAFRTVVARGSVLVRRRIDPGMVDQGLVPLQLQVMEPDWLDRTRDDGSKIIGGKVYDDFGRWVSAFLYDAHPGESNVSTIRLTSTEVPAAELLHCYEMRRPGQYTGVPWGAAVLLRARDLADYESAEILKQKLAACFAAFVVDTDPESEQEGDDLTDTLEPGLIQRLSAGQDVRFSNPPTVEAYGTFMEQNLRAIAAGYGITYESLTGDLSKSNFSAGRMAWLEFHRNVTRWQWNLLVPQLLDPVGVWYRNMAQVVSSSRAPRRFQWTPPRREMVNPKEEMAYLVEAVRAGAMSLSEMQRMLGYVPSDLMDELKADLEGARDRGLKLSVDGTQDVGRLQVKALEEQVDSPDPAEPADGADSVNSADNGPDPD